MKLPKYPLASSDKLMTFEFISEGQKGLIHKLVRFQPTNLKEVYNLAFGDKDHTTGDIDDTVISNNGDSEKVLATVVATVYALPTNIRTLGFMRQEAQNPEHDFTEWELQNFFRKLQKTLKYWANAMTIGKCSKKMLSMTDF